MEELNMSAESRTDCGKGHSGRMRRAGFIPAVLYGPGVEDNLHVKLNHKEVDKALHTHSGSNVIVNLNVDGKDSWTVMFKNLQVHPATGVIEHVDLVSVIMDKKVVVEVPVQIIGKAEGVKLGGILQQETRSIKLECLPDRIPDSIDVDVTELDIGQSLHVNDIKLAEGLSFAEDENHTIVLISAPAAEVEEAPVEEELEGAEAAPAAEEAKKED